MKPSDHIYAQNIKRSSDLSKDNAHQDLFGPKEGYIRKYFPPSKSTVATSIGIFPEPAASAAHSPSLKDPKHLSPIQRDESAKLSK